LGLGGTGAHFQRLQAWMSVADRSGQPLDSRRCHHFRALEQGRE
jgi:hypothetical protein